MMFIIVHQSSELWMRLMLHELRGVLECVRRDDLDPSFKKLARVTHVQTQLIATWDVLSTMTPSEYSAFRNALGRSSGFQSVQYRGRGGGRGGGRPRGGGGRGRGPRAGAAGRGAREAPAGGD